MLTSAPCTADGYVVVVVDDLYQIKSYFPGLGFVSVPLSGWMTKLNLLVNAKVPVDSDARGYQILSLDFEAGLKGVVKRLGAIATQKIPSFVSAFEMSSGTAGTTLGKTLENGALFSAKMTRGSETLVDVKGTLRDPHADEVELARFVASRPHKFLQQTNGDLVWAPWGAGWKSDVDAIKVLELGNGGGGNALVGVEALMAKHLTSLDGLDFSKAFCFVQPFYSMIDSVNVKL